MGLLWSSAILLSLLSGSLALSPTFLPCQTIKPAGVSPLRGCPKGTVYVSHNTSDKNAHYHSISTAVKSGAAIILIAEGEYHETVVVTSNEPLTLLGQLPTTSSASAHFADRSHVPFKKNLVKIWNNLYSHDGITNAQTAVLLVTPPNPASNTDFKAYNIDFENRAANYAIAQALATDVASGNASFYGCSFSSYQDTWYTGKDATTYVVDSIIYGQVDYIFGYGTAWFQNSILANRACGGGIVAWKGTSLTDAPGNKYGAYIADSYIIRSPDANATRVTHGLCYLGRPWNELATAVYLRSYMDDSINPIGWTRWNNASGIDIPSTTFYAEYQSKGPGGKTSGRASVSHILTSDEANNFSMDKVFNGRRWIDFSYLF